MQMTLGVYCSVEILVQSGEQGLGWFSFGKLLLHTIEVRLTWTKHEGPLQVGRLTYLAETFIDTIYNLQGFWFTDTDNIWSDSHIIAIFLMESI